MRWEAQEIKIWDSEDSQTVFLSQKAHGEREGGGFKTGRIITVLEGLSIFLCDHNHPHMDV